MKHIQDIPTTLNSFPVIAWRPIPCGWTYDNSPPSVEHTATWAGICYRHDHPLHKYVSFYAHGHNIKNNNWAAGHYYSTMEEALKCFQNLIK